MNTKRFVVCLFFVLACMPRYATGQKTLTMSDLYNPAHYPDQLRELTWIGNSNRYSYVKDNNLMVGDMTQKGDEVLLTRDDLNNALEKAGFPISRRLPSMEWINTSTFRFYYAHTFLSYDLETKKITTLVALQPEVENAKIHDVTHAVAYTLEDDLFISTPQDAKVQVTKDGGAGIVNGKTVHRNEFGIGDGIFWSPAGNLLAFYRKDESMVTQYPLVDIDPRIAEVKTTRYPMAGMTSEEVTVGVYDLKTRKTIFLNTGTPADQYLTNVTWSPDEKHIYIAVLNRGQDHLKLNRYNAVTGDFELTLFEETNAMYVEPENGPLFLPNNPGQFIWQSERNGWNHLYLYDVNGKLLKRYTNGNWMVTNVAGFDPSGNTLYYYATEVSPLESHFYQLDLRKERINKITSVPGTHMVKPSADGKYFIDHFSNATQFASQIGLLDHKGKTIKTILPDRNPLEAFGKVKIVIDTLTSEDGTPLWYRMILPPDFDESKKYPVFFYLYGGPHNQLVSNSYMGGANLFLTYMAHQGYIVFSIDNRGTANRGFSFESAIHRKLGKLEAADQMKGAGYLLSLPYVDQDRMGIHGWSYGGFMTITMMQTYPGIFKAGVAGGPVVDWKYYEVMYGERYMDTPEENPMGYRNASLTHTLDSLQGRLLIIHGTMDDVVVWQHSLEYLKKSIEKKKLVDYFVYPGHKHNVSGPDRLHLYMKIEQYMSDHLK